MKEPIILSSIESDLAKKLNDTLEKAIEKHAPFTTFHQGYAVILEELDELWNEVKAWQPTSTPEDIARMRKEAFHVAAMAIRFIKDLCP